GKAAERLVGVKIVVTVAVHRVDPHEVRWAPEIGKGDGEFQPRCDRRRGRLIGSAGAAGHTAAVGVVEPELDGIVNETAQRPVAKALGEGNLPRLHHRKTARLRYARLTPAIPRAPEAVRRDS